MYPLKRSDVKVRTLEGEMVVLDRRLSQIHQLNATASGVWERCDGRHSIAEIAAALTRQFEVDPARAGRDVAVAVEALASAGLLESVVPACSPSELQPQESDYAEDPVGSA